ncbi:tubulin-like doman-containing protein [Corynebacterium sp.]|uniref:tubulin-like doman-containing protein n=1 Tax=Corynebacterium sp. TaxID=1720 RepID=UPI0026DB4C6F|nr:tubulin-like doman-containing protein [Corynebacterium sp.]MDO5076847.1 tubulin-like doman-containing protein [Corynebacterium sp.]
MQKVFVVGCGGSGAQTLAYMMDQLKTMLAERLPHRYPTPKDVVLPAAWQFVSVDVPVVPESAGTNLPNVSEAGGHYISCGSSDRYATVDAAVSQRLATTGSLGTIASWAHPNPTSETTVVGAGAGQYRAIGRMLILSKLKEVHSELAKAWDVLFQAETNRELNDLRAELYGSAQTSGTISGEMPVVFVVSSMAGGAGASMAIDVCRLLTGLDGLTPSLTSLFLVTPDIFSALSEDSVAGTNPNALSMFAELVAAQFGTANEEDVRTLRALGLPSYNAEGLPIGRVFPVGIRSGEVGARLGDGQPKTVYRALGRGLAALMMDRISMDNFRSFTLGNRGGLSADHSKFGWGVTDTKDIPWGSYGYAQLSMGRDRYGEYAAQRLANSAVEKLLRGHADPMSLASGDAQIEEKLNNNLNGLHDRIAQILPPPNNAGNWIMYTFEDEIKQWANRIASRMESRIPSSAGQRGRDWLPTVEQALQSINHDAKNDVDGLLYAAVYHWASGAVVQEKLLDIIRTEIGKYGVPYGNTVLATIRRYLEDTMIREVREVANTQVDVTLSPEMRSSLANARGKITDDNAYIRNIVESSVPQLRRSAVVFIARLLTPVLEDFLKNFIGPLDSTMRAEHRELEVAEQVNNDPNLGVAQLKTNVPRLWPDESQAAVPDRFSQAANEVFLTDVETFPRQFQHDIIESAKDSGSDRIDFHRALQISAQRVVSAEWESTTGAEQAPRDLLVLRETWIARDLTTVPGEQSNFRDPRPARFEFRISPAVVLERSRQYIRRPGFSFQHFISTSLREYVTSPGIPEHERQQRRQQIVSRFTEAMTNALPLAQINAQLVQAIYGKAISYQFVFSRIPLGGDEVSGMLEKALVEYPNVSFSELKDPFGKAMQNQGEERSIDIFGSYPNYLPVVFESLLPPIAEQWDKAVGSRAEFWSARRSRPLPAALPMSTKERHAMVAGWYIGRLTGTVYCPGTLDARDDEPVQVYDHAAGTWVNFATPMLTPVSRFRSTLDWLPNLLESVSLAWARVGDYPLFESVRPYMLLRQLYDSEPTPSNENRTLRAQRLLQEWLFSGERKSGDIHVVAGTEADRTPEERLAAAKQWLQQQGNNAQAFVPTSTLGAGQLHVNMDRKFGDIKDRQLASRVPVYHDIAPDVVKVTAELAGLLDKAYAAGPPRTAQSADFFAPSRHVGEDLDMPGQGEF